MIDSRGTSSRVGDDDIACRFIYSRQHLRSDGTAKGAAFLPRRNEGLSVTIHGLLPELGLWAIGREIAVVTGRNLHGRGDLRAGVVRAERLEIERAPTPTNPDHAEIVAWPEDLAVRQMVAQLLANSADVRLPQS